MRGYPAAGAGTRRLLRRPWRAGGGLLGGELLSGGIHGAGAVPGQHRQPSRLESDRRLPGVAACVRARPICARCLPASSRTPPGPAALDLAHRGRPITDRGLSVCMCVCARARLSPCVSGEFGTLSLAGARRLLRGFRRGGGAVPFGKLLPGGVGGAVAVPGQHEQSRRSRRRLRMRCIILYYIILYYIVYIVSCILYVILYIVLSYICIYLEHCFDYSLRSGTRFKLPSKLASNILSWSLADQGATIVVVQALCSSVFSLFPTQNTCLFTDGNNACVCVCVRARVCVLILLVRYSDAVSTHASICPPSPQILKINCLPVLVAFDRTESSLRPHTSFTVNSQSRG